VIERVDESCLFFLSRDKIVYRNVMSLRRVQSDVTELTRFSFWRTDQWASSNALQYAPSSVGDYVTMRAYASTSGQWALPACPWSVREKLNHVSSVQLRRSVRAFVHSATTRREMWLCLQHRQGTRRWATIILRQFGSPCEHARMSPFVLYTNSPLA